MLFLSVRSAATLLEDMVHHAWALSPKCMHRPSCLRQTQVEATTAAPKQPEGMQTNDFLSM